MRCPKCHYISFDSGDRCRNCGYEFSLAVDVKALDLPIQTGNEPIGPFDDFALADRTGAPSAGELPSEMMSSEISGSRPAAALHSDLPLFKERSIDGDAPLVTPPAIPRPPLAVRRPSPVVATRQSQGVLSLSKHAQAQAVEESQPEFRPSGQPQYDDPELPSREIDHDSAPDTVPAPAARRVFAAVLDALILGTIDLAVLYFTLRLCGLRLSEAFAIPPVPFCAFLLLMNGGYFVSFTVAGGQTIGKMAAGIKVVSVGASGYWSDRVPLGHAVLRAAAYLISVLPAGLGMLPAFFSADRRAIHDRLADTRVIKA